ncbi:MAG TPA: YdeI/OmpD-associated family protein [Lacunisphaera sp.]|nr:YdeI/OmpD-associated family protein [Lacunisphaera sp.]
MGTDPRLDAYIANAAPFARPILARLRRLVHRGCPEAEETIKWGMPSFVYRGKILCGMAAFKAHATFGFWHRGMEKLLAKEIGRTNDAMGLFGRISQPADLPADKVLLHYIRTAQKLHDSGAPARMKSKPRPALPVPSDLASALRKNRLAATAWADFSPSARREYIAWITEAKRPATRERRVRTTIDWVATCRPRQWKYQDC